VASLVPSVELGRRGGGQDGGSLIIAAKGGGDGGCWMRRCLDPVETGLGVAEH
jgi:hypothetical protein